MNILKNLNYKNLFFTLLFINIIFIIYLKYNNIIIIKQLLFDHINIKVNKENLNKVNIIRKHILKSLIDIFKKYKINYTLSHGNLIEISRKDTIFQDDDIDIRLEPNSFNKWMKYCKTLKYNKNDDSYFDEKYNIKLDSRANSEAKQRINGIQITINNLELLFNEKVDKIYEQVHCDVVLSTINTNVWVPYDIDFNKIRKTNYMGINNVNIPSINDTERILTKEYGDYKTPIKQTVFIKNNFYYY